MKQKRLKHVNKQNHGHWGKQTTMSGGFSCNEAAAELGSPTVAHCYGERESYTLVWLAWRKKHTVKVHVQGHNDKGRRLVHCTQRTMLTTTASLFAEWLQVSLVENVHLTKPMRKLNVTLSLFILWGNTAVRTQRNVSATGHHTGSDEDVMIYLWLCLCLYENMPAERQNVMFTAVIDKWSPCSKF